MSKLEELLKKLLDWQEIEGEDARLAYNTLETNPWYFWVSMALLCLYYGDIESAKTILDGLICHEEL